MKKTIKTTTQAVAVILLGGLLNISIAQEPTAGDDDQKTKIRNLVMDLSPGMEIDSIVEAPVAGLYELISGSSMFYISDDGRYLVEGSIIDLKNRVNLSQERRNGLQMDLINKVPEDQMIVYNNASGDAERHITVFTDTDCGFCQKLHAEIGELTAANVRVRYLLFPRAGIHSHSGKELESVWCAADQQEAMNVAKTGGTVSEATCDNPISSHIELAGSVGLTGTPLIYLDDGTKIGGYRSAKDLLAVLHAK